MAQNNFTTKNDLNKSLAELLAELKADHERRGELIKNVMPFLVELIRIENDLPEKELTIEKRLRESVGLPIQQETIRDYLKKNDLLSEDLRDDFPVEHHAAAILADLLGRQNEEIPF